jgi:hypothetical protein
MPKIDSSIKDAFRQFSRNGRWGTCSDCPRDSSGNAYPEFCEWTDRYDHNLDVDALADQHKIRLPHREAQP